jgi:hypothetical protein
VPAVVPSQPSAQETLDQCVFGLGDDQWDIPELRHFLAKIMPDNTQFADRHAGHERRPATILLSFQDIARGDDD